MKWDEDKKVSSVYASQSFKLYASIKKSFDGRECSDINSSLLPPFRWNSNFYMVLNSSYQARMIARFRENEVG